MGRIVISVFGAGFLFLIALVLGRVAEERNIDKMFHVAMGIFLAIFFSYFLKGGLPLFFAVLLAGAGWEVLQLFFGWNPRGAPLRVLLYDSYGDIVADMIGYFFYMWWLGPHFYR